MDELPDAASRTAGTPRLPLFRALAVVAVVVGIATAAALVPWQSAKTPAVASHPAAVSTETTRVLAEAASQRPVYKYSILPGGAASREELAGKAAKDKVAAAHYANFEIDKAHVTTVSKPRAVHVSYRKGDRIYWTKRKMTLAAGETLLTDGRSSIRTRCGNRVSDTPQLPVEAGGPSEDELDTIVPASAPVPEEGSPVPHQPGAFAGASPTPDTPARTRTAAPVPGPGGFGIPGGGGVYVPRAGVPGSPGSPGSPPNGPVPTDITPGGPQQPGTPLAPPIGVVPEPQPAPRPGTPDHPRDVPEPGTLWLGLVGAGALLLGRRRKR
jgi:hypothetical protein